MESRRAASYIKETARLARLALGPTGAPFEVPRHAFAAAARGLAREDAGVAAWDAPVRVPAPARAALGGPDRARGAGPRAGALGRGYPAPGPLYDAELQPPAPRAGPGPSPGRLGAGAAPAWAEGPPAAGRGTRARPPRSSPRTLEVDEGFQFHRTSPPSPRAALGPRRAAGPARPPPTREAIADLFHLPVPRRPRHPAACSTRGGRRRWRWGRGVAPGLDRAALAAARRALLAAAARVRADPDASVTEPVLLVRKILGPHGL
eukprot:tig00000449_g941.t1